MQSLYFCGLATGFCAGSEASLVEDACRAIDLKGSFAPAWQVLSSAGVRKITSTDL